MTEKVLYFTADRVPTSGEQAEIDLIAPRTDAQFTLGIRNAIDPTGTGSAETCDYVAGSPPDDYSGVDVLDPEDLPAPSLAGNQAVITDGVAIEGTGGTFTPTIEDGEITGGTWTPE